MKYTYEEIARSIDHSLLQPTLTDAELEEGCRLAAAYGVAAVCIKPYAVPLARAILRGTPVAVCTVIGFPHGSHATEVKRYEADVACRDGAAELDMVVNVGKALSGAWEYVELDIRAVVDAAHKQNALCKVIFENDFLTGDAGQEAKLRLCEICGRTGADFVKTSTGYGFVKGADGRYGYRGSTEEDLVLMRGACPPPVRIKAAGGIRDLDGVIRAKHLGAERIGASATAAILDEYRRRAGMAPIGAALAAARVEGY